MGIVTLPLRRLIQAAAAWILVIAATMTAQPALSANSAMVKTDQAVAELVAHAPDGIRPGASFGLGLQIKHQPHWHTYWKNPGDSGLPTTLTFSLPEGFTVSEIEWPTPRPLPVGPLMNFGYEGTLLLPVVVTVPQAWKGVELDIQLRADWLICKDVCIPEGGDFRLRLPAQSATALHAAAFSAAKAATPLALPGLSAQAQVGIDGLNVAVQQIPQAWRGKPVAFLPELPGVIDNAAKPAARWDGERWSAVVALSPQRSESPSEMMAVLVTPGEPAGLRVPVTITGTWPAPGSGPPRTAASPAGSDPTATTNSTLPNFWGALALAFFGGVLLNLMPCVFPILSLKVLGFASQTDQRNQLWVGGVAYTVGVMLSFLALAGLLMALRAGGEQLGWGFQLQSPLFVASLAALFTLIGLNLAGVFELGSMLPGSWAAARARNPVLDAGLTGVLAVAVASPCTAPFMGASLGLAATLPAPQALAIFGVLGLGMAAPYLLASAWPGMARALPRPGAWMGHFKTLMAFPMFATVIWLIWVIGHQTGIDGAVGLLGVLLALSFLTWAFGSPQLSLTARRGFAAVAIACLGLSVAWAVPSLTATEPESPSSSSIQTRADQAATWGSWSENRVKAALDAGQPVFIDFTAAWCVTCQFNKRTVLNQPEVLADMQTKRVVLLRADWTRKDSAITAELARMGRNGVPVYALHSPGEAQPRLLGEILSVQQVRDALKGLP